MLPTTRWAAPLLGLLTAACTSAPAPPPDPLAGVPAPRVVESLPLARARLRAEQVAARYGLVPARDGYLQDLPNLWQNWPTDAAWTPLMPGRIRGLRGELRPDSLVAYTHGDEAMHYELYLRYPAFAGPRATDSLRRAVLRLDNELPLRVAALRRQPLYDAPEPVAPPKPGDEIILSCASEELQVLDCVSLGAYCTPTDTLLSTGGTSHYDGHCGQPS